MTYTELNENPGGVSHMRKGEAKRQEMLAAAERLFCTKGYDATSVQDILDVLHASKGGFYHHFASKEEVLQTLCAQRAARMADFAQTALAASVSAMERINAVLYAYMPMRRDEAEFIAMLLPLILRSEGRAMAMLYQDELRAGFLPLLQRTVSSAADEAVVFPAVKGIEAMLLQLVNGCWLEIACEIAKAPQRVDTAVLLTLLERYRRAVEVLLDAPYGSIELIGVQELDEVVRRLVHAL